ncbi:DUF4384 domain-containing protein [Candidatus Halobeggiatoa sp. HSG11]|nr:DUF4384 domain-containing protein [Candidatus Halobeggiatoa sp. HSG11]
MKMEIKFDWKDALIVAIAAPMIVGIVLIMFQTWLETPKSPEPQKKIPTDIVAQVKSLQNPAASFSIAMWINNIPNVTEFTTEDEIVLHYKVGDFPSEKTAYLTLFNISPTGELSQLLFNKTVKNEQIYSLPESQTAIEADAPLVVMPKLTLEIGQEYFKAIVTNEPIDWKKFIATNGKISAKIWGTTELVANIK